MHKATFSTVKKLQSNGKRIGSNVPNARTKLYRVKRTGHDFRGL